MPRHRFADTRDRIESAAIHLFVEKSVDGTTVRDIAGRVELSEGRLEVLPVPTEMYCGNGISAWATVFREKLGNVANGTATLAGAAAAVPARCKSRSPSARYF